jgi:hypothetical protein
MRCCKAPTHVLQHRCDPAHAAATCLVAGAAAGARIRRCRRRGGAAAPRADVNADAYGGSASPWQLAAVAVVPARPAAPSVRHFDFIVIGSGIAGLSFALKVAPYGSVAVITKDAAGEGCTAYAQGGVCAVLDPLDSVERHVHDTLIAGAFLNDPK